MAKEWYALRVKPHKERAVYQQLIARDIETFYPSIRVKPKNPRSAKERPFFPGYLFVNSDLEQSGHNAFSWMPGTSGLVSFGGIPAAVPHPLIEELQKKLAELKIEELSMLDNLKKGDKIRIIRGPFEGYEGIFDTRLTGNGRVQVLLSFLSAHPQPAKLDADDIIRLKK